MGHCHSKQNVVLSSDLAHKHQETRQQRLLQAISIGDLPRVRLLLLECQAIRSRNPHAYASLDNDDDSSSFDINQPVTINAAAARKVPLLHFAAGAGQLEICQYLVHQQSADVSVQDAAGWTALHYATHRGRLNVARWLVLHAQASVRLRNNNGETPLHKLIAVVKVNKKDPSSFRSLSYRVSASSGSSTSTTSTTDEQQQAQEQEQYARDMFALLRFLIEEAGAEPADRNHNGDTLLDLLEQQNARSSTERIRTWTSNNKNAKTKSSGGSMYRGQKSFATRSYADFAESDYDMESTYNSSSDAYTALSLSHFHVDTETNADSENDLYYDQDDNDTDTDADSLEFSHHHHKDGKYTITTWIKYLKPLSVPTYHAPLLKTSLTPDTSLDDDQYGTDSELPYDLDNALLFGMRLGGRVEI